MSYYVPTIPTQTNPVVDSTAFHIPYVRDYASLELDARHDVAAAQDRARVQESARHDALTANRTTRLDEQAAVNRSLDEQIDVQKARIEAAVRDAYSPKGPFLTQAASPTNRPVFYASGMGL